MQSNTLRAYEDADIEMDPEQVEEETPDEPAVAETALEESPYGCDGCGGTIHSIKDGGLDDDGRRLCGNCW